MPCVSEVAVIAVNVVTGPIHNQLNTARWSEVNLAVDHVQNRVEAFAPFHLELDLTYLRIGHGDVLKRGADCCFAQAPTALHAAHGQAGIANHQKVRRLKTSGVSRTRRGDAPKCRTIQALDKLARFREHRQPSRSLTHHADAKAYIVHGGTIDGFLVLSAPAYNTQILDVLEDNPGRCHAGASSPRCLAHKHSDGTRPRTRLSSEHLGMLHAACATHAP